MVYCSVSREVWDTEKDIAHVMFPCDLVLNKREGSHSSPVWQFSEAKHSRRDGFPILALLSSSVLALLSSFI